MDLLDKIIKLANTSNSHNFSNILDNLGAAVKQGSYRFFIGSQEGDILDIYREVCEEKDWDISIDTAPFSDDVLAIEIITSDENG